jgi:hypothetical protein
MRTWSARVRLIDLWADLSKEATAASLSDRIDGALAVQRECCKQAHGSAMTSAQCEQPRFPQAAAMLEPSMISHIDKLLALDRLGSTDEDAHQGRPIDHHHRPEPFVIP